MIRCLPVIALVLASCSAFTFGTSTTQRPAITKPAIGPDGAFWDAAVAAKRNDHEAFLYLLSPQMVYLALFPEARLAETESQEEFDLQRATINAELEPFEPVVHEYTARYMHELTSLLDDKFAEASQPVYSISHTGAGGRAEGPNQATITVRVYPKQSMKASQEPEVLNITFIQDGRRWLIHRINPDPLKGAFVR
ncbi:MAG: hypothetical protein K8I27_09800 [Planctomycetes bacterium]|nr:hypothetical protein [Planctomycetota bacterium]